MKMKLGVLIFVFLTGLVLVATQPALLYAGTETPSGNAWDPFVDTSPFKGTKLSGPLSIYLEPASYSEECGNYKGTMFYTVRLSKGSDIYTFHGKVTDICFGNIGDPGSGGQGDVIMNFLGYVVGQIFGPGKLWKLKSVDNPGTAPDSQSFVADIVIAVY
jgi:hypothetical protein